MKSFDDFYVRKRFIAEDTARSCVFTFGRFQPLTRGHQLVFNQMSRMASQQGAAMRIFTSQTQDQENNPLSWRDKIVAMARLAPRYASNIIASQDIRTVFDVAMYLHGKGFQSVTMVVGSDRVASFNKSLLTYNGKRSTGSNFFYQFKEIDVVQAGDDRLEGENSMRGLSGAMARRAARSGDYEQFRRILPEASDEVIKSVFMNIRKAYGLGRPATNEELETSADREEFYSGVLLEKGDSVMYKGEQAIVESLGCNFARVRVGEDIHKAWISDIERI